MKTTLVVLAVFMLGLVTPLVLVITTRHLNRQALIRRGDIPLGKTTPELTEYFRGRISHGRKIVMGTFLFALVTATALGWGVSGSPIAGAGAFVAVIVMWGFSSLALRAWVAAKSPARPPSAVAPQD